ncbi:aminoglycoside phosphotransferase [Microtetraspora sp. NBRC 13810]|uniref:phosphotransferase n=1 Tax=Microtetraspora sp. NBRC 13810 TaxID=3030990 RepID=UPI0024A10CA7|nr:phosphotransferase [Microtetraspora sp. NBRC 13810]GLW06695.1 aminoglycoside phosphotransferase [Microtetraspora sp. NBRC 13810]
MREPVSVRPTSPGETPPSPAAEPDPAPATPLQKSLAAIGERHARTQEPAARVLVARDDVVVVRVGDVVVKAHAPGMDAASLRPRLAASARLPGVMLPPLSLTAEHADDRLVSVWPAGSPVDPGALDEAPWEAAARLLARLHLVPLRHLPPLPPAGGPARVSTVVARLRDDDGAAARTVRAAAASLPPEALGHPYGGPPRAPHGLTHGDWHLGQLVRHPPEHGEWLLIDVDDVGHGDQAWDLARPAAWFAAGLLEPAVWHRFLAAYVAAGGPALDGAADPWERLDIPARALAVQVAAAAVATARRAGREIDEAEQVLVDTCARIAAAAR